MMLTAINRQTERELGPRAEGEGLSRPWPIADHGLTLPELCPDTRRPGFVVQGECLTLRYANAAGRAFLAAGRAVQLEGRNLHFSTNSLADQLKDWFRTRRDDPDATLIVGPAEDGAVALRVTSVLSGTSPAAMVHVLPRAIEPSAVEIAAFAKGFGLTEAEAGVLALLVEGRTLTEIARQRATRPETVRNQCKSILAKFGCRRQIDVVRLVLSLCASSREHPGS